MIMSAIKIELPVSKSLLNRAMIAIAGQGNLKSWLEDNSYIIANGCRDTQLLINALTQDNSAGESSTHYFQDAGTPCRLYTAFAAANFTSPCQITGNESLNSRSIEPLVTALIEMGADISYSDQVGFTPIFINAGITEWSDITISAAVSSQFASALLLMAPLFKGDKKLIITDSSHSQAYIEMTVHLLNHLGIETSSLNEGNGLCITINGDYSSSNTPIDLEILESDWSSAAFFYPVLLGLPKDATIELLGLKMSDSQKTQDLSLEGSKIKSSQGDSAMCVFGNFLGIETIETEKGILINRHPIEINQTLAFLADDEILDHDQTLRIDLKNNPDLVPALVVGWCILGKSAIISGIHNLRFKECDRILAIQENIKGLGCTLTMLGSVEEDRWILNCSGRFFPAQLHIHTQSDHRIAMAFSALNPWIAALSYTDTACVEKSFPQFWEQLKKCTFD
ncbi:MAG: 3-phosphoshikimate 1-carboxyvinyltransferase [Bacteroidota bacterium]|jgi:3-phosphoshikimate 1-carboxyvinyltransferase